MTTGNKENMELPRHKRELTTEGFEVTEEEGQVKKSKLDSDMIIELREQVGVANLEWP